MTLPKMQQRAADAVRTRAVQRINTPVGELTTRAASNTESEAEGFIHGRAVPYNTVTDRAGWDLEQIRQGAVVNDLVGTPLMYEHRTSIGKITAFENRDDGLYIDAKISQTTLGKDVIILVNDGGVAHQSIGFVGRVYEYDAEAETVTWTEIEVVEVSLVPVPAYADTDVSLTRGIAKIEAERAAVAPEPVEETPEANAEGTTETNPTIETREVSDQSAESAEKENTMNPEELAAFLESIRTTVSERGADSNKVIIERLEDLERNLSNARPAQETNVVSDRRSAGAFAKALVRGEDRALNEYKLGVEARAYADTNEVLADTHPRPVFVGDLTKIAGDISPITSVFSTGVLPKEGNTLEYAELNSNTITVAQQVNEGDTLVKGKLSIRTRTADVITLGGYTELSRQAIERSSIPILDRVFEAQAKSLGFARGNMVRGAYVAARDTNAAKTGANAYKVSVGANPDAKAYIGAVVDGASLAANNGVTVDTLLVGPARFKALASLTDTANRPVFNVYNTGTDVIGRVNPKALTGEVANVVVVLDPSLADGKEGFVSNDALRLYTSNGVQLSDSNVTNLTNQFSIYQYAAIATEIPNGIIPVVFA